MHDKEKIPHLIQLQLMESFNFPNLVAKQHMKIPYSRLERMVH